MDCHVASCQASFYNICIVQFNFQIIQIEPFFLTNTQVLHEETTIPGTDLKLSYLSSRAAGYKSVLKITMTQSVIPFNLMKVHLMVAVVGRLFQKWFPASPNLAYTFIWDKTDAYNQRVYGLSEAVGMCAESRGGCLVVCFSFFSVLLKIERHTFPIHNSTKWISSIPVVIYSFNN